MSDKTVLVSACLAGLPCRYDGKPQPNTKVIELIKEGKALVVCPEQLAGFLTPRPPAEIKEGRVYEINGKDVTHEYNQGAAAALKLCKISGCKQAILKGKSPMCGSRQIYDGSFTGKLKKGQGVLAKLLQEESIEIEEAFKDTD